MRRFLFIIENDKIVQETELEEFQYTNMDGIYETHQPLTAIPTYIIIQKHATQAEARITAFKQYFYFIFDKLSKESIKTPSFY